jgi:hypothetical protein
VPDTDLITARLRRAPVNDRVRADAWDAFHNAADQDDFAERLRGLSMSNDVKADLWDLKAGGHGRPVSSEDFTDSTQPEGSAVGRFFSNAGEMLNPVTMVKGLYGAVRHPIDTGTALVGAQIDQARKAKTAFGEGRYSEAVGHGGAAVLPLLGPAAAAAGEQMGTGDVAGGLGKGVGLLAPVAIGAAVPKRLSTPVIVKPNAAAADALALAERSGVPLDAATATGNRFVKAIQHVSDRSLAGSLVAEKATEAQRAGLATLGEQLAAKAHPRAVAAGEAGSAAQKGVGGVVSTQRGLANDAYGRLRAMESDPANMATFEPAPPTVNPDAPWFFTKKGKPTVEDVFPEALKDARSNGYTGTVGDLREKFDARVQQARGLKEAVAEGDEYSHAALLKKIRDEGGLRPYDTQLTQGAPSQKLRGEHIASQQANANYYGKNAIYRNDGLETSDMLQRLSEDPKWGAIIMPDTDLTDLIHRGALKKELPPGNLEHHLRGSGVYPGAQWWREGEAAQHVPMAVDLSEVKASIRPIAERLAAKKDVVGSLMGKEGTAAARLDAILSGPDVAPLSVADSALSDLKSIARTNHPDLRNVGQGIAAKAVGGLHKAVSEAAERAGPDAVSALAEGRQATIAKYAAADVLKRLEGAQRTKSPVTAFRGMTQAGDTGFEHLRDVVKQVPETKPMIARAVLDGLIEHPTAGAAKTWADWQKLGPETKRLLYTPEHVRDLDAFFKLRKMMAENPNPSGTAHTILSYMQGGLMFAEPVSGTLTQLGTGALSTLLHSPTGVRLLTKGMRLPAKNTAAGAAWLSDLMAATSPSGSPAQPAPATGR